MTQNYSKDIIVARVNAEELYEQQLEEAVKNYNDSLKEQGINIKSLGQDQLHNVRKFMLVKMVERELLHQEAVRNKIKVTKKEIDQIMQDSEKHYPSHQSFLDDILKDGITIETYRDRLAYDMLVNKVASKRYEERKKQLSSDEVHRFYQNNRQLFAQPESVNIGHILLKLLKMLMIKNGKRLKRNCKNFAKVKKIFVRLQKNTHNALPQNRGVIWVFTSGANSTLNWKLLPSSLK